MEKLVEMSVRYVLNAVCVVTERFEMAVERPTCNTEKFEPDVVDSNNHDVEIPLVVRNPTVLMATVIEDVRVEKVEPVFVLRFDSCIFV